MNQKLALVTLSPSSDTLPVDSAQCNESRMVADKTSRNFRLQTMLLISLLAIGLVVLAHHNFTLKSQIANEASRVSNIAVLLDQVHKEALSVADLTALESDLKSVLTDTSERLEVLEDRSLANQQVIAAASQSVVFLQGSYILVEPQNEQRSLRHILGAGGRPLRLPNGFPAVSLEGDGQPLEINFTGTGFIATEDGLLLSNRHVAQPWEFDDAARALIDRYQLKPVMQRFIGYLPAKDKRFTLTTIKISEQADLAILRSNESLDPVTPLRLSQASPLPGDEVIVIGYPTGLVALLARLSESQAEQFKNSELDFWAVAKKLSEQGRINPLANAGIIGQVAEAKLIYDAATTSGGSGGPVLSLDGEVVAINTAILKAFGGSNIGVPASYARQLLDDVMVAD